LYTPTRYQYLDTDRRRGDMSTVTYPVDGMVCAHCAASVSAELERVPGVTGVRVDLAAGTVTVTSEHPLDDDVVRAAVEEAGFLLGL
jgi:copper chaperone CopZ